LNVKSPVVVLPVKGGNPKSRLSGTLGIEGRRELVRAMIRDVLAAVKDAGLLEQTIVVSPDRDILNYTSSYGAREAWERRERGVNAAVEMAIQKNKEAEGWLILPADVPFITKRDLKRALEFTEAGADVVISPSRELDGTNLLLIGRERKIQLSYDRNSFRAHIAEAARRGYSVAVYCSKTVMLDIDSVEDVEEGLASGARNETTTFLESRLERRR